MYCIRLCPFSCLPRFLFCFKAVPISRVIILRPFIRLQHTVLDLLVQLRSNRETDILVLPGMDLPAGHEHGQSLLAVCHTHPCHQELPIQAGGGNGFQPALVLVPGNNLALNLHQSLLLLIKIPVLPLWAELVTVIVFFMMVIISLKFHQKIPFYIIPEPRIINYYIHCHPP